MTQELSPGDLLEPHRSPHGNQITGNSVINQGLLCTAPSTHVPSPLMAMTGSLYRGTPRLGGVWQFQPALPAEKGTPGRKPAPLPPSSYCVHWTRGTEAQGRVAQGCSVRARTPGLCPWYWPPPQKLIILPQPSRRKGEASGQTSSQEQGHLHTACVPNTAAHWCRGHSGDPAC